MAHKFVVSEAILRWLVYNALRIMLGTEMNDDTNPALLHADYSRRRTQ
jgi:hypothetical protein